MRAPSRQVCGSVGLAEREFARSAETRGKATREAVTYLILGRRQTWVAGFRPAGAADLTDLTHPTDLTYLTLPDPSFEV